MRSATTTVKAGLVLPSSAYVIGKWQVPSSVSPTALSRTRRFAQSRLCLRGLPWDAVKLSATEFGVVTARGPAGVKAAIAELHGMQDSLPPLARMALHGLLDRLGAVGLEIRKVEREIVAWCRHDDASRRPDDDPRDRADHRERDRRDGIECIVVPVGPAVRALARPDAAGAQKRRGLAGLDRCRVYGAGRRIRKARGLQPHGGDGSSSRPIPSSSRSCATSSASMSTPPAHAGRAVAR
jgi:hypothetical protein